MKYIDNFLNKITMYRLVLYGLTILAAITIVFGFTGVIAYSGTSLLLLLGVLLASNAAFNFLFATAFKAPRNVESVYITAFILFFLLDPSMGFNSLLFAGIAGFVAMGSKYIFAIKRRHIFNPAAIAAVALDLIGTGAVIWWVATPYLIAFVLILGLLIVRKIRRFPLFFSFLITNIVVNLLTKTAVIAPLHILSNTFLSWPTIFFATVMVTEPLTMPPTKKYQTVYGIFIGALSALPYAFGRIFSTPELALVLGNIYAYIVGSKQNIILRLKSKTQLSDTIYDFAFEASEPIRFTAGQYVEWTLPHDKSDSRGNRRFFTIASSPTSDLVHLGVRIDPKQGSSFKNALMMLKEGRGLMVSHVAGEFTLPKNQSKKLVFIAGGVGITPFASMVNYLLDMKQRRDIVLMYAANAETEFAYKEMFERARDVGVRTEYVVAKPSGVWTGRSGYITPAIVSEDIPDYKERMFYLSGPQAMVQNYKNMLLKMGIHPSHIKTDYFPGF